MKSEITLHLRHFPMLVHDHRTGQEGAITLTVTKDQLRAAQLVGQSSKELIERLCDRQGYTILEIGKPSKMAVNMDLDKLVEQQEERDKFNYLYGTGGGEAGADA